MGLIGVERKNSTNSLSRAQYRPPTCLTGEPGIVANVSRTKSGDVLMRRPIALAVQINRSKRSGVMGSLVKPHPFV